jgi:hypothetical protein
MAFLSGSLMTQQGENRCKWRWRRSLWLPVVVLFVAWTLTIALHSSAFATASDSGQAVAAYQPDVNATDQHGAPGHACTAQGHCSMPAILSAVSAIGMRAGTLGFPFVTDTTPLASVGPFDRPPNL